MRLGAIGLGLWTTSVIATASPVVITGGNVSVAGLASHTFAATGGVAPYTWSLSVNASGGSIVGGTGVYTAGPTWNGSVDVVQVTDSIGQTATVSVTCTIPVWSDVGLTEQMRLDASGLTAGAIAAWNDLSATGANFTQVTGPSQPTAVANAQNGLTAARFSATGQNFMTSTKTDADIATKTAWTFFVACKVTASTAADAGAGVRYGNPCLCGGSSWLGAIVSNSNVGAFQYTTADKEAVASDTTHAALYFMAQNNGTNIVTQLNQGTAVTGDASTSSASTSLATTLKMGRDSGNTHYFDGDLYEVIAFNTALSAPNALKVQKYLAAKWKNAAA